MAETDATEIEKYIHNLEFENEQFVKTIEKEQSIVKALEGQLSEYEGEIERLQSSTSQLDEDTKLYHRQFIQNRDSIENLRTSVHVSQHLETLKGRYQQMVEQSQQEEENYGATLEHYSKIWEDYKLKYSQFPQARVLNEANTALQQAQDKLSESILHKKQMQEALNKLLTGNAEGFQPYMTAKDFIVKLAEIGVSRMKKEAEVRTKMKNCQEIERKIQERQREVFVRKQQIQEAQRQREEEAERARIAEQKKREEEILLAKKSEEQQMVTENTSMSPPPPRPSAHVKTTVPKDVRSSVEETRPSFQMSPSHPATMMTLSAFPMSPSVPKLNQHQFPMPHIPSTPDLRQSSGATRTHPTLQMPPVIGQKSKTKVPFLEMPSRPSAFMPQLCIPPMSPRVPRSPMSAPSISTPTIPAPTLPTPTIPSPTMPAPNVPSPTVPAPTITNPMVPIPTIPASTVPASTPPPLALSASATSASPAMPFYTGSSQVKGIPLTTSRESAAVPMPEHSTMMKDSVPTTSCYDVTMESNDTRQGTQNAESLDPSTKSVSPPPVKTPRRGAGEAEGMSVTKTPEARGEGGTTPKTPKTPVTPGTTASGNKTPITPGDFNLERQLAKLKLITSKSPGFQYGKRPMFEGGSTQEDSAPTGGDFTLPFFQTFQPQIRPQGGGDEPQKALAAETSPKASTSSPVQGAEKTPAGLMGAGDAPGSVFNQNFLFNEPGNVSTHAGSGMDMFGSSKNQALAEDNSGDGDAFNFFASSSGPGQMSLFGNSPMGASEQPKSSNVFSMFGGDSNPGEEAEEDTFGGFSFNFGGAQSEKSDSSNKTTPFSLF